MLAFWLPDQSGNLETQCLGTGPPGASWLARLAKSGKQAPEQKGQWSRKTPTWCQPPTCSQTHTLTHMHTCVHTHARTPAHAHGNIQEMNAHTTHTHKRHKQQLKLKQKMPSLQCLPCKIFSFIFCFLTSRPFPKFFSYLKCPCLLCLKMPIHFSRLLNRIFSLLHIWNPTLI